MANEYKCYSEEWVEWLQGRLGAENGGDWDKDPLVLTRYCPVCGDHVDCVAAERLRGYGMRPPNIVRYVCVFCGFIHQRETVTGYLMSIGRHLIARAL